MRLTIMVKKSAVVLLFAAILLLVFAGAVPVYAVGNYGVDLSGVAYQSDLNYFLYSWVWRKSFRRIWRSMYVVCMGANL